MLARAGLVGRALLYALVGVLAARLAWGRSNPRADKEGAFQFVARQPFGRVLLLLIALAFAGYALWRFIQAVVDRRITVVGKGLLYVLASGTAFAVARSGQSTTGRDERERELTIQVLGWPGGRWLVAAVGLALIAAGLYNGYRGLAGKYRKRLKPGTLRGPARRAVHVVAVVGMASRMIVFVAVGAFVVRSAVRYDPGEAVGVDGALHRLAERPYGQLLLGAVAAGLIAFGAYCLIEARFRRLFESDG